MPRVKFRPLRNASDCVLAQNCGCRKKHFAFNLLVTTIAADHRSDHTTLRMSYEGDVFSNRKTAYI